MVVSGCLDEVGGRRLEGGRLGGGRLEGGRFGGGRLDGGFGNAAITKVYRNGDFQKNRV